MAVPVVAVANFEVKPTQAKTLAAHGKLFRNGEVTYDFSLSIIQRVFEELGIKNNFT